MQASSACQYSSVGVEKPFKRRKRSLDTQQSGIDSKLAKASSPSDNCSNSQEESQSHIPISSKEGASPKNRPFNGQAANTQSSISSSFASQGLSAPLSSPSQSPLLDDSFQSIGNVLDLDLDWYLSSDFPPIDFSVEGGPVGKFTRIADCCSFH